MVETEVPEFQKWFHVPLKVPSVEKGYFFYYDDCDH